jgi:hypothetical protein
MTWQKRQNKIDTSNLIKIIDIQEFTDTSYPFCISSFQGNSCITDDNLLAIDGCSFKDK